MTQAHGRDVAKFSVVNIGILSIQVRLGYSKCLSRIILYVYVKLHKGILEEKYPCLQQILTKIYCSYSLFWAYFPFIYTLLYSHLC